MSNETDFSEADRVLQLLKEQMEQSKEAEKSESDPAAEPQQKEEAEKEAAEPTANADVRNEEIFAEPAEPAQSEAVAELPVEDAGESETEPQRSEEAVESSVPEEPQNGEPADVLPKEELASEETAVEETAVEETSNENIAEETVPEEAGITVSKSEKRRERRKSKRLTAARLAELEKEVPLAPVSNDLLKKRKEMFAAEQTADSDWEERAAKAQPKESAPQEQAEEVQTPAAVTLSAKEEKEETVAEKSVSRLNADEMLEGLIADIFGEKNKKAAKTPPAPLPEKEKKREETPVSAPVQNPLTEEELPKRPSVPKKEPIAKHPPAPAIERKEERNDAPHLEFSGYTFRMPTEEGESEKESDLFGAVSLEENGRTEEPARQPTLKQSLESSEEDLKFLLDMDYEKELGETIGYERIREYRERVLNGYDERNRRSRLPKEYVSHEQDITLYQYFAKQRKYCLVNTIFSFIFLLLTFVYESKKFSNLFLSGKSFLQSSTAYLIFGVLLLCVNAFIVRKQLISGFSAMFKLAPIDYSLSSLAFIATLIYHVVLFFVPIEGKYPVFFSPMAANLLILSVSGLLDSYRESAAFRVVSSKDKKYALLSRASVGGSEADAEEKLRETETYGKLRYVHQVGFVRNFFYNSRKKVSLNRWLGAQFLLILSFVMIYGFFAYAESGSMRTMLYASFITFLFALPGTSVLSSSLPMFFATVFRLKRNGAIIGEEPVYACGGKSALVLSDADAFDRMDKEQYEMAKDCDVSECTVLIRALLDRIESPMAETLAIPSASRIPLSAVNLTDISPDGVSAEIKMKKAVIKMGSVAYMKKNGIGIRSNEEGSAENPHRRLIGVAINNRVVALFLTKYRLHKETEPLFSLLYAEDVELLVRSKDPSVDNNLIAELYTGEGKAPTVQKPTAKESDLRAERADVTVVAVGSGREAVKTFAVCRRVRRAARFCKFLQSISLITGVAVAGFLTFIGIISKVPSLAVVLYILFWCGLHTLTSYLYLHGRENN